MSTFPDSTASSWWKQKTCSAASSGDFASRMLSRMGESCSSSPVFTRSHTSFMHSDSMASRVSSRERTSFWRRAPPL